jgi:parallel beta-helix repeat protein
MGNRLRKLLVFEMILILLGSMIIITVPNVSASSTYYVDGDEGDDDNDGSYENPWQHIWYALDQVNSGDTINIFASTYTAAPYSIDKPGIKLVGYGLRPTINGGGSYHVISIKANDVTIENLYIKNSGTSGCGIYLGKPGGAQITNCIIKDNILYNNYRGIHTYNSKDSEIDDNLIFENNGDGVLLVNSNENIIKNNLIYNNIGSGILLKDSDSITINNNEIFVIGEGSQKYGIHIKIDSGDSKDNIINDNLIFDNNEDGIYIENSDHNTIKNNEIYNDVTENQLNGIHIKESDNNIIQNNNKDLDLDGNKGIYKNMNHGIYLDNCIDTESQSRNTIENNWIHKNRKSGVYISDSNWIKIEDVNRIFENWENGIHLYQSNKIEISDNIIKDNTDGIHLDNSYSNNNMYWGIKNNEIKSNFNGIHFFQSYSYLIFENYIHQNSGHGIYLE